MTPDRQVEQVTYSNTALISNPLVCKYLKYVHVISSPSPVARAQLIYYWAAIDSWSMSWARLKYIII